jgi:[glutamine synthetase] adenylyltransferase / [glutamine synthetase]-adenylyl-L-tyrosine phosphorylase
MTESMKRAVSDLSRDELEARCRFAAEAWRRFPDAPDPSQPVAPPEEQALSEDPMAALRRYRQLASVNMLWQDLSGHHDIAATGQAISTLAGNCLDLGLEVAEARIGERFGRLLDAEGRQLRLAVIGLGKLGGNELNFNSDIDLVFARDGSGQSDGPRRTDAANWLGRAARELIGLIDAVTAQGRVWIVDTRLRPFGEAGAMVWSLSAMEQYFLSEGRAWERYAWLKAAPTAGDRETGGQLINALEPFIYRRYLDYGIFESLRELHMRIDANSRQREDDIKRGPGGIREMEFLVQSLQILRGGREPDLRQRGFLPALAACEQLGLMERQDAREVREAYGFMRILENRLQAMTGRQGHRLPEEAEQRANLAWLMGVDGWSKLAEEIDHHRQVVRKHFAERFREPDSPSGGESGLWPVSDRTIAQFEQAGFAQPQEAADALRELQDTLARRPISAEGRQRLDRLMPRLLSEILEHRPTLDALKDLLRLIERIARRSAYLSLLYERPETLKRLVRVFHASARVAEWIIESPQLIDDLLDPVHGLELPAPPTPDPQDHEASLWALGRWRQAAFLRTALAELDERLDVRQVGHQLSGIAGTILDRVLALVGNDDIPAVIAYGNLGAEQLHYGSDLDLVFLHRDGQAPVRTVQRLISAMQMPLPGGRLFEIDTRLRPNGRAGLLVSPLDSFADYQADKAWTWEHQALIRARWVAGDKRIEAPFERVRQQVLTTPCDPAQLARDLATMRRRQIRERQESPLRRRLTDLQFVAELGILQHAARSPELVELRSTPDQLGALAGIGWLDADTATALADAWTVLMRQRHGRWLRREFRPANLDDVDALVGEAWSRYFPAPPEP